MNFMCNLGIIVRNTVGKCRKGGNTNKRLFVVTVQVKAYSTYSCIFVVIKSVNVSDPLEHLLKFILMFKYCYFVGQ